MEIFQKIFITISSVVVMFAGLFVGNKTTPVPPPIVNQEIKPSPTATQSAQVSPIPAKKTTVTSQPVATLSPSPVVKNEINCTENELNQFLATHGHSYGGDGIDKQKELDLQSCSIEKARGESIKNTIPLKGSN